MEVGENSGEKLPVFIPVAVSDRLPIKANLPRLRQIQASDDLRQSGFSAPVATHEENQFARPERQIYWAQDELTVFLFRVIGVDHAFEFQPLEAGFGFGLLDRTDLRGMFRQ